MPPADCQDASRCAAAAHVLLTIHRLLSANTPLPLASCLPAGCHVIPVVALLPPLVLSTHRLRLETSPLHLATRRRLLSAGASPLSLSRDMPPPLVCWCISSHLPLICRLVLTYHLIVLPLQVSILDPRGLHSHWLVVASHLIALLLPTILSSTPPPLDALATHLPFASRSPHLVACLFDLVCPISHFMAICQGYAPTYLYTTWGGGCISDMSICSKNAK